MNKFNILKNRNITQLYVDEVRERETGQKHASSPGNVLQEKPWTFEIFGNTAVLLDGDHPKGGKFNQGEMACTQEWSSLLP